MPGETSEGKVEEVQAQPKRLPTPRSGSRAASRASNPGDRPATAEGTPTSKTRRLPTPRTGERPASRAASRASGTQSKEPGEARPEAAKAGDQEDEQGEAPPEAARAMTNDEIMGLNFEKALTKVSRMPLPLEVPKELTAMAEKGSPLLMKLTPIWSAILKEDENSREIMGIDDTEAQKLEEVLKCQTVGQVVMLYDECGVTMEELLHHSMCKVFADDRKVAAAFELCVRIVSRMIRGDDAWREEQLSIIRRGVRRHRYDLQRVLKEFDVDGDGLISEKEFRKALKKVGIHISRPVLAELYHGLTYGANKVSAEDFIQHAGIEPTERALTVSRQEKTFLEKFLKEEDWVDQRKGMSKDRFTALCSKYKIVLHGFIKNQMLDLMDSDKSGDIDQRELMLGVLMLLGGHETDRKELLFDIVDANGDGLITKKELTVVMGTLNNDWVTEDGIAELRTKRDELFDSVDGNKDGAIDKAEFDRLIELLPELDQIVTIKAHDQDTEAGLFGRVNMVTVDRRVALAAYHLHKLVDFIKERQGLVWMHQNLCEVKVRVEYGNQVVMPRNEAAEPVVAFEYWVNSSGGNDLVPRDVNGTCEVLNKYAPVEFMHRSLQDQTVAKVKDMIVGFAKRFPGMSDYLPLTSAADSYALVTDKPGSISLVHLRAMMVMEFMGNPAQKAMFLFSLCKPKARQSVIKEMGAVVVAEDLVNILAVLNRGLLVSFTKEASCPVTNAVIEQSTPPDAFASAVGLTVPDAAVSWTDFLELLEVKQWLWELFKYNSVALEQGQSSADLLAFA